jgi:O-antigen/teichoic acid export membrane protein
MILIKKLFGIQIVKNLSILVSGSILAQIIAIGFQVVLRRIYSPEDFGAFAVYMSVVGIVVTLSALRYEQAIMLPKHVHDGISILKLSIFLILITSVLLIIPFVFFDKLIISLINFPLAYKHWIFFIPISILVFGIAQAMNYYLIREKRFKLSAANKIVRRVFEGISQLFFGAAHRSFGLFLGDLIGQIAVTLSSWIKIIPALRTKITWSELKNSAIRYKDFPYKNGIPSLMNALSLLLPIIIINRQFSEEITGYFDLARTVLIVPLSLITASLSQVLLQQFSEKRHQNKSIKKQAMGTFISLTIFALFFGLVIQFFGVYIFQFIFGQQWDNSGVYAGIMVWAFALKFIVSPFNIVFTAFERIGILSIWQTFYFALILLLAWLPFSNINDFLWAFVVIELVSYGIAGILNAVLLYSYEKKLMS